MSLENYLIIMKIAGIQNLFTYLFTFYSRIIHLKISGIVFVSFKINNFMITFFSATKLKIFFMK